MPKAAVDKNGDAIFWQNYVRFSGKIFPVQAKAISQRVQYGTYSQFRLCVFSLDRCHIPAALFASMNVSHLVLVAGLSCSDEFCEASDIQEPLLLRRGIRSM